MITKTIQALKACYWIARLPCKEASQLISRSMDQTLPWRERVALRLHLLICRLCRRYQKHLRLVAKAMRQWPERILNHPSPGALTDQARNRIKAALDDISTHPES